MKIKLTAIALLMSAGLHSADYAFLYTLGNKGTGGVCVATEDFSSTRYFSRVGGPEWTASYINGHEVITPKWRWIKSDIFFVRNGYAMQSNGAIIFGQYIGAFTDANCYHSRLIWQENFIEYNGVVINQVGILPTSLDQGWSTLQYNYTKSGIFWPTNSEWVTYLSTSNANGLGPNNMWTTFYPNNGTQKIYNCGTDNIIPIRRTPFANKFIFSKAGWGLGVMEVLGLGTLNPTTATELLSPLAGAGEAWFTQDGQWVVFTANPDGYKKVYRVRPNGTDQEMIFDAGVDVNLSDYFPDNSNCGGGFYFTATPTFTPVDTNTVSPTFTHTRTSTSTETITPTRTVTPTRTATNTNTPTLTKTNSPTTTITKTITVTQTVTPTATKTEVATSTPTFTTTTTNLPTLVPVATEIVQTGDIRIPNIKNRGVANFTIQLRGFSGQAELSAYVNGQRIDNIWSGMTNATTVVHWDADGKIAPGTPFTLVLQLSDGTIVKRVFVYVE